MEVCSRTGRDWDLPGGAACSEVPVGTWWGGGAGAGGGESSCWEEALGEAPHFRAWCLLLGRKVGTKANSAPVSVYNGRLWAAFLLDSRSQDP